MDNYSLDSMLDDVFNELSNEYFEEFGLRKEWEKDHPNRIKLVESLLTVSRKVLEDYLKNNFESFETYMQKLDSLYEELDERKVNLDNESTIYFALNLYNLIEEDVEHILDNDESYEGLVILNLDPDDYDNPADYEADVTFATLLTFQALELYNSKVREVLNEKIKRLNSLVEDVNATYSIDLPTLPLYEEINPDEIIEEYFGEYLDSDE